MSRCGGFRTRTLVYHAHARNVVPVLVDGRVVVIDHRELGRSRALSGAVPLDDQRGALRRSFAARVGVPCSTGCPRRASKRSPPRHAPLD